MYEDYRPIVRHEYPIHISLFPDHDEVRIQFTNRENGDHVSFRLTPRQVSVLAALMPALNQYVSDDLEGER